MLGRSMNDDHSKKAGNQGDVVKHVALIAACRIVFNGSGRSFRYVDGFAGPAGSLLLPGGEWTRGVGKVDRSAEPVSPDVGKWFQWYLPRPQVVGSRYPGSALIAADIARDLEKRLTMTLFDISCDAVCDLRSVLPKAQVVHDSVSQENVAVGSADLLFIDPPRLGDLWPLVLALIGCGRNMLAWLPINAAVVKGRASISHKAEEQLQTVCGMPGTYATRTLWARGGRTMGCDLVYRGSPEFHRAIRVAVSEVVELSDWKFKRVEHFDPL